jgi:hypothetical protein
MYKKYDSVVYSATKEKNQGVLWWFSKIKKFS